MFGADVKVPYSDAFESKVIAIDYDETFSLDPILFLKIISLFRKANFDVICCTFRAESQKDEGFELLELNGVPCYFTAGVKKSVYLKDKGISVSVWIDDDPSSII